MKFHPTFPCLCPNGEAPLTWQTITKNGLTVHNVPVYVCPKCGDETIELISACVYDEQVADAYTKGLTEITLVLPDDAETYLWKRGMQP